MVMNMTINDGDDVAQLCETQTSLQGEVGWVGLMGLCGYIDGILLLALVPLQSVVSVFVFVPFHVFVFCQWVSQ